MDVTLRCYIWVRGRIKGDFSIGVWQMDRSKVMLGMCEGRDGKGMALENRNKEMLFKEPGAGNGMGWIPN